MRKCHSDWFKTAEKEATSQSSTVTIVHLSKSVSKDFRCEGLVQPATPVHLHFAPWTAHHNSVKMLLHNTMV